MTKYWRMRQGNRRGRRTKRRIRRGWMKAAESNFTRYGRLRTRWSRKHPRWSSFSYGKKIRKGYRRQ